MWANVRNLLALADGDNPLDDTVALFIVQLIFILLVSRVLGFLFRFIKQPQVIAEVITGILLGPTVWASVPGYARELFSASSLVTVTVVANLGLIFFMFLIGIELDPGLLKRNAKSAAIIAFASMAAPFGIGAALSVLLYHMFDRAPEEKFSTFLLFCGVAMSITAFPVLARILTETRLTTTKVGLIAMSAAAVNDVVAWVMLAVVVSIAKAKNKLSAVWTLLIMFGYLIFMIVAIRPLLKLMNKRAQSSAHAKHQMVLITFILVLASAWFTEVIGVHAIFGGFVMGVISPRDFGWAIYITERIEDVIIMLLLPLYFTVSGLNTNLRTLQDGKAWGMMFAIVALACFGKIVGSLTAAKFLGNTWRESLTVGILMNTKGLVELIVLNLGKQVGVLTDELFAMFVMMAVLTTMLTSPLLHFIWIREQKKKSAPLIHDAFSVMMCISNQTSGLAMVSIAGTLAIQKRKKFSLHALHVTEVTDSPSSYFFAHRRPPPHFLELVRERSRALSLPLKIKQIFAVHVADDIEHYCNSKHFDLILIAWNEPIIERGGSKIRQVLAHIPATVGVLINRGIDEIVQVNKVLAVYSGEPYQKDSLKIARLMSRKMGVGVTLISSVAVEELGIEHEPINVIMSEKPMAVLIEESRTKYDLVIVGIAREWSANEAMIAQTSELLSVSTSSVLLVHPKMEGKKKHDRNSSDSDEDKAKLFWGDSKLLSISKSRNKSRDFSNELESGNSSPNLHDSALKKSKSKLRVESESFDLDSQQSSNNNSERAIDFRHDYLRNEHDEARRRSGTDLQRQRSESTNKARLSKSHGGSFSHSLNISTDASPPPPQSTTPKLSPPPAPFQPGTPRGAGTPRAGSNPSPPPLAASSAIVNADSSSPPQEGDEGFVYVD